MKLIDEVTAVIVLVPAFVRLNEAPEEVADIWREDGETSAQKVEVCIEYSGDM